MRKLLVFISFLFTAVAALEYYRPYVDGFVPLVDRYSRNTIAYNVTSLLFGSVKYTKVFGFTIAETQYGLLFKIGNIVRTTIASFFIK